MKNQKHKVGDLVACKVGTEHKYKFALGTITKINHFDQMPESYIIQWADKPGVESICSVETLKKLKKLLKDILADKAKETDRSDFYIGA